MSKLKVTLEEQIEKQKEKLEQLKARKQAIEARKKSSDAKKLRADDTRRKILAGAFLLNFIENENEDTLKIKEKLGKFLTKDNDRALFGFSPISQG